MKAARILVVEDEALAGRDYQTTLVRLGYSVPAVVQSGAEALDLVRSTAPDLVLLNARLRGGMDGFATAKAIQEISNTPILFLSGADDDLSMNRARAIYPYGYLIKPVTETDLRQAVETTLARAKALSSQGAQTQTVLHTLQSIEMGVIAADLAGNVAFMNRSAEELTGWASEEAMGKPLQEVFRVAAPHANGNAHPHRNGSASPHSRRERQTQLWTKDGSQLTILDQTVPLETEDGGLSGVVVVFREKPAGQLDSPPVETPTTTGTGTEDQLANIAKGISDPLLSLDLNFRVTYANPEAAQLLDEDRADLMGAELWACLPTEEVTECRPHFERALQEGRPRGFEYQRVEDRIWYHVQLYPYAGGLLAIYRDISERKKQEVENRRLERLEGLGLLARGFAHDFNNLLTVLLGNLCLAQGDPTPEELKDQLEHAMEATVKAQGLVQQLMTFAQGGAPIRTVLDPIQLLTELVEQRQRSTPGILFHVINDAKGIRIEADSKQIRRVLENIFTNAEQAMDGAGSMFVRCRVDEAEPPQTQEMFVMEVIDSGIGMTPEEVAKVFEPFYTSRREANATGLGLTVCDSIARAHGGYVRIQSRPGKGTITSVHLPASSVERNSQILNANILTSSHCIRKRIKDSIGVRILVLEDETRISTLIQQTLSQAGYEVQETSTGDDAIAAFRNAHASGNPFDVLIVDLTLKDGMGGIEALKHIREIDPDVCAIVSSGYNDDPAMADPASYGFSGVLPKPYEPQQLLEIVGQLAGKV